MEILSSIDQSSASLMSWSLTILGGTFLVILSSSFNRPNSIKYRLPYLLFIPAWACLIISMKIGDDITGRVIAARIASSKPKNSDRTIEILSDINLDFIFQQDMFLWSLVILIFWLLSYLFWWIFDFTIDQERE